MLACCHSFALVFLLIAPVVNTYTSDVGVKTIDNKTLVFATNGIPALTAPFYVHLDNVKYMRTPPMHQYCGGAIIDPHWIVTSAQCLINTKGRKIPVEDLEVQRRDFTVEGGQGKNSLATDTIIHPEFSIDNSGTPSNDIGLIRVKSTIAKRKSIKMCDVTTRYGFALHMISMGFLVDHFGNPQMPKVLQEVTFTASMFKYSTIWNVKLCPEDTICTDPVFRGTRFCFGDIGSPLFKKASPVARNPRLTECLMGVASHSKSDKYDDHFPFPIDSCNSNSYFTSIPYYYDWIMETFDNFTLQN